MSQYIDRLIELAQSSVEKGGRPFACLIVKDGVVIAEAVNQYTSGDPTAHAELLAIRKVMEDPNLKSADERRSQLEGSEFFVLSHPCPMCLAAIIYCNPNRVVFCAEREDFAQYFKAGYRYATYSNLYSQVAMPWQERDLPMELIPDNRVSAVVQAWRAQVSGSKPSDKSLAGSASAPSQLFTARSPDQLAKCGDAEVLKEASGTEALRLDARYLNQQMKTQYQRVIHQMGRRTFPLIVALDNEKDFEGVGGSYTLFLENGTSKRIVPAKDTKYEIYKDISHLPLWICAVVIPYLGHHFSSAEFANKLSEIKRTIESLKRSMSLSAPKIKGQAILDSIIAHSERLLHLCSFGEINLNELRLQFDKIAPLLRQALKIAVEIQMQSVMPELEKWKQELGPDLWEQLYVVVPTIWTVSKDSPREQAFRNIMAPGKVQTNLIVAQGITNLEDARTLLGRVVFDRQVADLVFGRASQKSGDIKAIQQALSSQTDIAALDASHHLNKSKL